VTTLCTNTAYNRAKNQKSARQEGWKSSTFIRHSLTVGLLLKDFSDFWRKAYLIDSIYLSNNFP
jgi:hypothetical protein